MELRVLADLGEFVGGLAVIASLAYLALQVRQNTQSLRTENYGRALDRIASIQSLLARDRELARMFARAVADPAQLTPVERIQFTWGLYEFFGAFEFMFHASRAQTLPAEIWERWCATTVFWLSFPGVQRWWESRPAPFTASFTAFIDGLRRDGHPDSAALQRWGAFVAGRAAAETPVADRVE